MDESGNNGQQQQQQEQPVVTAEAAAANESVEPDAEIATSTTQQASGEEAVVAPNEGGFMKPEDLQLETAEASQSKDNEQLQPRGHQGQVASTTEPPSVAAASVPSKDSENSPNSKLADGNAGSTSGSSPNAGLKVDTANLNGRSSSPSGLRSGRLERKASPPPTPPARLQSSEGNRVLKRTNSGNLAGSSSPAAASSARLQGAIAGSSSKSPESNSMKRSASPLMGSSSSRVKLGSSSSSSPPPAKEARTSRSTSPPLETTNSLLVPNAAYRTKSRSLSPGNRVGRSSSPRSDGSSSPQIGPQPDSAMGEVRQNGSAGSSSPPPIAERGSSSPARPPVPSPRRVKIYALLDGNWIDLGTGSCTYHRGLASRKRRKITSNENDAANSGQPSTSASAGKVSIAGRAAREAAKRRAAEDQYVEEIEYIELDPVVFRESDAKREELSLDDLEPGEEEAAWIEVVKEGRWKSDPPAPSKKERKRARQKKLEEQAADTASGAASQVHSESDNSEDTLEEDGGPEYPRQWQARIEKPVRDALGLLDIDCFTPQPGAEGENEEVIGRYRRQQDTLIVWKSASVTPSLSAVLERDGSDDGSDEEEEMEVAMSFAATSGCAEVWEFLKEVHKRWEMQYLNSAEGEEDAEAETLAMTHGGHYNASQSNSSGFGQAAGQNGAQYGLGFESLPNAQGPIPIPELGNLVECEKRIKFSARTAVGRERLAAAILKADFIKSMCEVFREAEDLESIADLHMLCHMMHDILNLNDQTIWEYVLEDDNFFDIVSILEYDPDFPNMKATYRTHLSDPHIFVEVVPLGDAATERKIHEVYRLQYMKDVILPRALEDSAFTIINSFIYFHQVDIVQYLFQNEGFWKELFGLFPDASAAEADAASGKKHTNGVSAEVSDKQVNAVAFLQSYAQMVKTLQPGMRASTFRKLSEVGVLRILGYCLSSPKMAANQAVRVASVEILMLIVDHDTASIRNFVLKEVKEGKSEKSKTLLTALIGAFQSEQELGVKAQLAEAIRVLVLPAGEVSATETAASRVRADDPNADAFMQYFYDHCIHELLEPITKTLKAPAPGPNGCETQEIDLAPVQISHVTHLCDLLCFFVTQHTFRSKFFIISTNVGAKVSLLLRAKPKHVRLAALRFFRACIGRNDDFYSRYLVKHSCLLPILELTKSELHNNNLLSSACLELFEFCRVNNLKTILNNLMEIRGDELRQLAEQHANFRMLVQRWEMNNDPQLAAAPAGKEDAPLSSDTAAEGPSSSGPGPEPAVTIKPDERSLSTEEERYFDADDDDEPLQESQLTPSLKRSGTSTLLSRFVPAMHGDNINAVKIEEPADADGQNSARRKRQKLNDESPIATGTPSAQTADVKPELEFVRASEEPLPEPETDPEQELARIREKRKREAEEDDEEDGFARKKGATGAKPATGTVPAKKAGVAGAAAGGIKLLFGQKKT